MGNYQNNPVNYDFEDSIDFSTLNIGIAVSEWNSEITDALFSGAVEALLEKGCKKNNIYRHVVPGSYLYYQKANGTLSKKVFKISEKTYAENSSNTINRKQSFKVITTRKFHVGEHQLSIIINGNELEKINFKLDN